MAPNPRAQQKGAAVARTSLGGTMAPDASDGHASTTGIHPRFKPQMEICGPEFTAVGITLIKESSPSPFFPEVCCLH